MHDYEIADLRKWLSNMVNICSDQKWNDLKESPDHLLFDEVKDIVCFNEVKKKFILGLTK